MTQSVQQFPSSFSSEEYFRVRYPDFHLAGLERDDNAKPIVVLEHDGDGVVCPQCGAYCRRFREKNRSMLVRDFDLMMGGPFKIRVPTRRLRCRCGCGRTEPDPSWVLPGHRVTKLLAGFAQNLLRRRISNSDVASLTGLSWALVKELDKSMLKADFDSPDISRLENLIIDEISIHKGHSYATVFMDGADKSIVRVVEGKSQKALMPTFEELEDKHNATPIKSVSVDMNAAFPALVEKHLPGSMLAYDLFHVVQLFNTKVLVEARKFSITKARDRLKALPKKDRTERAYQERDFQLDIVRDANWLVVRQPDKLLAAQGERLKLLRENNALFGDLYPLMALIRGIWKAPSEDSARSLLQQAIEICQEVREAHEFKPIGTFAKTLQRRAEGIINACKVGIGTNLLEGANNTAKVIKRIAYGFRDFEYFSLKLKAAFPGKRFLRNCRERPQNILIWGMRVETLGLPHLI